MSAISAASARVQQRPAAATRQCRRVVSIARAATSDVSSPVRRATVVVTAAAATSALLAAASSARGRRSAVIAAAGDAGAAPITIKVGGMVCDGCSGRVEAALKAAPGVAAASVDLAAGTATVTPAAGAAAAGAAALVELIKGLGFEASLQ